MKQTNYSLTSLFQKCPGKNNDVLNNDKDN